MPIPAEYDVDNASRRNYYHDVMYKDSDIDIFIYGLNEEEGTQKLIEVYNHIANFIPHKAVCFRSTNAITIVSQYPYRHVQIILRLYSSPAEIMMGFDVDSCSVGFDGENVFMTPRAHRAIMSRRNSVDMSRRSPSYEYRLWKYSTRGFGVEIKDLDFNKVDPQIYEKRLSKTKGLTRLLLLVNLGKNESDVQYINKLRDQRLRPHKRENNMFNEKLGGRVLDDYSKAQLGLNVDLCDYSTVFLPWGPSWKAMDVANIMFNKDYLMNTPEYDPNKKYPTHPCFVGTMEEVILDCEKYDNPDFCFRNSVDGGKEIDFDGLGFSEEDVKSYHDKYVIGEIQWKTINPGEQKIGSFSSN